MMYTKKEIADSVVKFISNDVLPDIDDSHQKFVLSIAKKSLHNNPDVIDSFLDNPIVSSVIAEENDCYDVEPFARALKGVLSETESYSISIPSIPMFAPKDSFIKIRAEDIDKMLSYLKGEEVSATPAV